MIERMARAISPVAWGDDWAEYFCDEAERDSVRVAAERKATAALRELLEPSEGMVGAGGDVSYWAEGETMGDDRETDVGPYVAAQVITAAIQAALEGE